MVLLNRPNDPSLYNGLILVEPSDLKNENRYWTNCRRRVGFEFIESDTSWPNSWRMAFSVPTVDVIVVFHGRRSRRSYAKQKQAPRPERKYFLFSRGLTAGTRIASNATCYLSYACEVTSSLALIWDRTDWESLPFCEIAELFPENINVCGLALCCEVERYIECPLPRDHFVVVDPIYFSATSFHPTFACVLT